MDCIEEIINVPLLISHFDAIVDQGKIKPVIEEIILQSRLEFHVEEENSRVF